MKVVLFLVMVFWGTVEAIEAGIGAGTGITGATEVKVFFASGSAELSEQAKKTLDSLHLYGSGTITILGSTDPRKWSKGTNKDLALLRAREVANYLQKNYPGIKATITTEYMGGAPTYQELRSVRISVLTPTAVPALAPTTATATAVAAITPTPTPAPTPVLIPAPTPPKANYSKFVLMGFGAALLYMLLQNSGGSDGGGGGTPPSPGPPPDPQN